MQRTVATAAGTNATLQVSLVGFGFVAGFLAVLVGHQPMLALLHALGVTPATPYAMQSVPPFGVPRFLSSAFWGGVWGIVFALLFARLRGASYWLGAVLFGAVFPTLVAWFVVSPLKGLPVAAGFRPAGMATGLFVNGAWGLAAAALLALLMPLSRARSSP